jgi:metallo-beta-lactamase class B
MLCSGANAERPVEAAAQQQSHWAAACKDWDDWDKPAPPFQVMANTYYVGTCGISAILLVGSKGDILIDGGPANAAPLIARNIESLGFKMHDVKILLHSHEHHDHVGGLAELQRLTGARLLASPKAAPVLASGQASRDDPQYDEHSTFPAARVDGQVDNGGVVRLGDLELHSVATPGHTPGALSWHWEVRPSSNSVATIVYADSLTPVSSDRYRFSDHPRYLASFRNSIASIAALDCRYLLTPHPSASGMRANIVANGRITAKRTACRDYAADLSKRLEQRLAKEAHGR